MSSNSSNDLSGKISQMSIKPCSFHNPSYKPIPSSSRDLDEIDEVWFHFLNKFKSSEIKITKFTNLYNRSTTYHINGINSYQGRINDSIPFRKDMPKTMRLLEQRRT